MQHHSRSEELYRSIADPQVLAQSRANANEDVAMVDRSKGAVASSPKAISNGPALPMQLENFPSQPLSALFTATPSSCFDAFGKVLNAAGSGVQVQSVKRDQGKYSCVLEDDKEARFQV